MPYYAHTLPPPKTPADWEPLAAHLELVAEGDGEVFPGAAEFAAAFDASDWGRLLGWWHDVGKYSDAFQQRLAKLGDPHHLELVERVDHSTAGAQHAAGLGMAGRLLAYAIAGHHGGLPDDTEELTKRLAKQVEPWRHAVPAAIVDWPMPTKLPFALTGLVGRRRAFSLAFFTRMLFSCLVDADFLATEAFISHVRAADRPRNSPGVTELLGHLDRHLAELSTDAPPTTVNRKRAGVLAACREKAALPLGLFSLNVPTGGGKTLASLAFALTHAKAHGLRRVVYAIPFTSIIEQTADVFRHAVGGEAVLEVHSNLDLDDAPTTRNRLAAENFDAPLVVTTNVQLLESLFASGTSRCRKLHRLAGSVIVLDEAQTLPPNLLKPTLWALDELARNYGCTIVLCTATQPAIERRDGFNIGLECVSPIINDGRHLHDALRRTRVEVAGELGNDDLAERLRDERQVLCVVNTRRHARELFEALGDRNGLHLSANQCAAHRSEIVEGIRVRLREGEPCRVISTAVIEAGVDVDFPCVYRATAGLDSIAQAAGRCNREGRLGGLGKVVVFDVEPKAYRTPDFVRAAAAAAREVMPDHADDLLSPAAVEAYFRLFYWSKGGDGGAGWDLGKDGLPVCDRFDLAEGPHFQFREAAERYRLIDDAQTPVLVPWEKGVSLRKELEDMPDDPDPAWLWSWDRRAQRYVVGVFDHELRRLRENTILGERFGRFYLNRNDAYDGRLGLLSNVEGMDADLLTSV